VITTLQIPREIVFKQSVVLLAKLIDRRCWMKEQGIEPLMVRGFGFKEKRKIVEGYVQAIIDLARYRLEQAQEEIEWPMDVAQ
jgi:hypothetical protein